MAKRQHHKSKSITPDSEIVRDVDADALRWARARTLTIARWRESRDDIDSDQEAIARAWDAWTYGPDDNRRTVPREPDWADAVERWLEAGFTADDLIRLIPKAMHSRPRRNGQQIPVDERWRYFCGVVWRTLDELEDATKASLMEGDRSSEVSPLEELEEALYKAYDDGFADGRDYERNSPRSLLDDPLPPPEPRMCVECDERPEHGSTGLCMPCWAQQNDAQPKEQA